MFSSLRRCTWPVVALAFIGMLSLTLPVLATSVGPATRHAPNATFTVTNTNDSGPGSLRQAVDDSYPGDTINFSLTYPAIITLTSGQILVDHDLAIAGPGADQLTIRSYGAYRIFEIGGDAVTLADLTVAYGVAPSLYGGGIYYGSAGVLTLTRVNILSSTASYGGGVFLSSGNLTLNDGELGGNSASSAGGGIFVYSGNVTLNGGKIHGNVAPMGGGLFAQSGDVTLSDGQIISNTASSGGGGVYLDLYDATFTMTGGALSLNTAYHGGAAYINYGSMTMNGGQIISNRTASTGWGGGVFISSGGNVLLHAGQVVSNTAGRGGGVGIDSGNVLIDGGEIVSNTATNSGGGIYIRGGGPDAGGATLAGGQIAANTAADGGGVYVEETTAVFTQTGVSTITRNTAFSCGGGVYSSNGGVTLNSGQIINNTAFDGGGVCLSQSAAVMDQTSAHTIAQNTAPYHNGGGLYVYGGHAVLDGGRVMSNTAADGGGIWVAYTSIVLTDVQIISNTANTYGGGMYLERSQVTLNGGEIRGNYSMFDGGGVYAYGPTTILTQTGGNAIAYNNALSNGGGVYAEYARVVLSDGRISNNTANQDGGGVYMGWNDTVLTQGGTHIIAQNTANGGTNSSGGGLYMDGGQATLEGGQIVNNSAAYWGGGISARFGEVTLAGVQVISNTAYSGGGIYIGDGRVTLSGGEIRGNEASEGGGVHVDWSTGAFTQTGTSAIAFNKGYYCSGLYVNEGTATLLGGQILGNTATGRGGGICVYSGNLVLNGGQILSNTATSDGGGIHVFIGNVFFREGRVLGNIARSGGGLFVGSYPPYLGAVTLSGGEISGNIASSGSALYSSGSVSSTAALTIAGDVHQIGGNFNGGSAPLRIEGTLTLEGGVFDAPTGGLTITDSFIHTGGLYRQTRDVNGSAVIGFPKVGGVLINANDHNLGSTQVTIRAGEECTNPGGQAVLHCYNITPTNSSNVSSTITFYFNSSELHGNTCETLDAYHWDGDDWGSALTLDGRDCSSAPPSLRVRDISEFSPFVLMSGGVPTAVTLQGLQATTSLTVAVGPLVLGLMTVSSVILILRWKQKRT